MVNTNLIVYGIKRTGTSLMMEMLAQSGRYIINHNSNLYTGDDYKQLQDFYYEGEFVNGITEEKAQKYLSLNKNLIKIMHYGLVDTSVKYFQTFDKIIIMNRYWVSQTKSTTNLNKINLKNNKLLKEKLAQKNHTMEYFLETFNHDHGFEYGYYYSCLVLDVIRRKYQSKLLIVNFEQLFEDPLEIEKVFQQAGLSISKGIHLIDPKKSNYKTISREGLREFHPGYFDYLDFLYFSIKNGVFTNDLVKAARKWLPLIEKKIQNREIEIYNEYGIFFSEWMNGYLKNLEKLNSSNSLNKSHENV